MNTQDNAKSADCLPSNIFALESLRQEAEAAVVALIDTESEDVKAAAEDRYQAIVTAMAECPTDSLAALVVKARLVEYDEHATREGRNEWALGGLVRDLEERAGALPVASLYVKERSIGDLLQGLPVAKAGRESGPISEPLLSASLAVEAARMELAANRGDGALCVEANALEDAFARIPASGWADIAFKVERLNDWWKHDIEDLESDGFASNGAHAYAAISADIERLSAAPGGVVRPDAPEVAATVKGPSVLQGNNDNAPAKPSLLSASLRRLAELEHEMTVDGYFPKFADDRNEIESAGLTKIVLSSKAANLTEAFGQLPVAAFSLRMAMGKLEEVHGAAAQGRVADLGALISIKYDLLGTYISLRSTIDAGRVQFDNNGLSDIYCRYDDPFGPAEIEGGPAAPSMRLAA